MKDITKSMLQFAKQDLLAAEKLSDHEMLGNMVLFHCQQSIEKLLKAHLEENDIKIPKIHNLIRLYNLLTEIIKKNYDFVIELLEELDSVYIDSRYPGDVGLLPSGMPSDARVSSIFIRTKEVFKTFEDQLK